MVLYMSRIFEQKELQLMNPLQYLKPVIATAHFGLSGQNDNPTAMPLASPVNTTVQPATTLPEQGEESAKAKPGVHVDISVLGRKKLEQANKDIDDSELPFHVKQSLKMIRRKQELLKQKQEELVKAQQDPALQGKQKEEKLKALKAEISDLQRMISSMKSGLLKAAEKADYPAEQMKSIATLMG
jgi:hypothetical protein